MAEKKEIKDVNLVDDIESDEGEPKIYEVGFHIIPTITTEDVGAEFTKVKSAIEEKGGKPFSEDFPKVKPLAYAISKIDRGVKHTYDKAYFSWIKFEADPAAVADIKKALESVGSILRFIIIKTIKENITYSPRPAHLRTDPDRVARRNKEEKEKAEKPISEAELDKTIEELVIG